MQASNAASLVNRFLAGDAGNVVISRIVDATTNPPTIVSTRPIRGFVRNYKPTELGNGIALGDSNVTIQGDALIGLMQTQLPGGVIMNVPRKNDKIFVRGRERNIEGVDPIEIGSQVVRVNLLVRG